MDLLLLDVFSLNLPHHFAAVHEVGLQLMRPTPRNFHKLIVDHRAPGNFTARRNHLGAPLKDESKIPQGKKSNHEGWRRLGKRERTEKPANSIQKNRQTKNKYGSQRNKKTVSVGRRAIPVRVAGDD